MPMLSAGGWREPETRDPGRRPAPCWALPGHGLNTERGFGTLARSYKDYLFKEGNKTGQHAKLRSMQQLSPLWKGYCWTFESVFLCSWAASLRSHLDDRKRQKQREAEVLGAGYADTFHPTGQSIAVLTQDQQRCLSMALQWSGCVKQVPCY